MLPEHARCQICTLWDTVILMQDKQSVWHAILDPEGHHDSSMDPKLPTKAAQFALQLVNTCLTFSPLHSEYSREGDSNETLVTQVSCYGDLGGWMSQRHPWRRLLNLLAPFSLANSWTTFIKPHVQTGIAMRNQASSGF